MYTLCKAGKTTTFVRRGTIRERRPIKTSEKIDLSWASSMIITEYLDKKKS